MPASRTDADTLIVAAFELAAEKGWRSLTMADIATHAGLSLLDAYAAIPDKAALIDAALARTDREMLAGGAGDAAESVRDRLFDMIMRRFDALSPFRKGISHILGELPADPLPAVWALPRFMRSMAWTLDAAGVPADGPLGLLRIHALALIYLATFRVWLEDDSPDLAKTMAALDRGLRRAESLARSCPLLAVGDTAAPAADAGGPGATGDEAAIA